MPATLTATTIQPLGDRLVVKAIKKDVTEGGIILPEIAQERPQLGEAIAVGPGKLDANGVRQPLDIKPGDRVLFVKFAGTEVKLDGEDYLLLSERDVLGIVR